MRALGASPGYVPPPPPPHTVRRALPLCSPAQKHTFQSPPKAHLQADIDRATDGHGDAQHLQPALGLARQGRRSGKRGGLLQHRIPLIRDGRPRHGKWQCRGALHAKGCGRGGANTGVTGDWAESITGPPHPHFGQPHFRDDQRGGGTGGSPATALRRRLSALRNTGWSSSAGGGGGAMVFPPPAPKRAMVSRGGGGGIARGGGLPHGAVHPTDLRPRTSLPALCFVSHRPSACLIARPPALASEGASRAEHVRRQYAGFLGARPCCRRSPQDLHRRHTAVCGACNRGPQGAHNRTHALRHGAHGAGTLSASHEPLPLRVGLLPPVGRSHWIVPGGPTVEERRGLGVWDPKICVPKMARQDSLDCKCRVFPRWSHWSWGGGVLLLLAIVM